MQGMNTARPPADNLSQTDSSTPLDRAADQWLSGGGMLTNGPGSHDAEAAHAHAFVLHAQQQSLALAPGCFHGQPLQVLPRGRLPLRSSRLLLVQLLLQVLHLAVQLPRLALRRLQPLSRAGSIQPALHRLFRVSFYTVTINEDAISWKLSLNSQALWPSGAVSDMVHHGDRHSRITSQKEEGPSRYLGHLS